jgi:hypothetical protein
MFFSASARSIGDDHDTSVQKLGKGGTRCPQRVDIVFGEADPPFTFVKEQLSITNRETL